jgi:hypothetical protein
MKTEEKDDETIIRLDGNEVLEAAWNWHAHKLGFEGKGRSSYTIDTRKEDEQMTAKLVYYKESK